MNQINIKRVIITTLIIGLIILLILLSLKFYYQRKIEFFESPRYGLFTIEELKKYKVPEKGEKIGENIAVPIETAPSAPESESRLRNFEIKGENGILLPTTFIVYQNDILNIKLTAIDQDYDFNLEGYNVSIKAKKGETKTMEFQAINIGSFSFYCYLCKQKKERPAGLLIVVPKK